MKSALWIMLNPSTADAFLDDQTAMNIIGRTTLWAGIGPPEETKKSAIISACGRYRYELRRQWPVAKPFLPMNPFMEGLGELVVGNLYAYRATDPLELLPLTIDEAIGEDTDEHLRQQISEADLVVCAWGNGPWGLRSGQAHRDRVESVMGMITEAGKTPHAIGRTKSGMPRHPLYFPSDALPVEFSL